MKELGGRTAIVTGASRGIGVFIGEAMSRAGMNLVIAARTQGDLEDVRANLLSAGYGGVMAVPTDVSKPADCEALFDAAEREFGTVDVLVNNAGVENIMYFHKLALEEIDEVLDINLRGAMYLTRLVLPGMLARGSGHIVNVSSLAGMAGPAHAESYATSKAGMIGFTQSLRSSYRDQGVSASVICPGFVDAGMYSQARLEHPDAPTPRSGVARPEQVAAAVIKAITGDLAEVIVNPVPVRPLLGLYGLAPQLTERLSRLIDSNKLFRDQAQARDEQREASATVPRSPEITAPASAPRTQGRRRGRRD
jgi:short-subunit dehydrogenase